MHSNCLSSLAHKQKINETHRYFVAGAGKGTHGPKIEEMLGIPQLSTGDMLRAAVDNKTEIGKKAEAIMKSGGLVSDDIVVGIIRDRIQEDDCKFGFILVRFYSTMLQLQYIITKARFEGHFIEFTVVLLSWSFMRFLFLT